MVTSKQLLGVQGEELIAHYLVDQGFTVLARNYKKQYGELDLVAIKGDTLAFVEVKARTYHLFEAPVLVPTSKQKRIIKTAYAFIADHKLIDKVYRFDIALIYTKCDKLEIDYIPDAFTDEHG